VIAIEEFEDRKSACARETFLKSRPGISERRRLVERP
jgi:hypothetical protein